jgi:hypothetical protein
MDCLALERCHRMRIVEIEWQEKRETTNLLQLMSKSAFNEVKYNKAILVKQHISEPAQLLST